ncbi:MAG: restriction endonuclease [Bacteroidales bacterium]|nr:restriction endonuclease [Bacteroidales bacterium]
MLQKEVEITKRSGEKVPFDVEKLRRSLENSGAGEADIEHVIRQVRSRLVEGISTQRLYQIAYSELRKSSKHAAGKYRLKKAIFDLGPTGYPFERFVGELLRYQGYRVEVGKMVRGHCVEHEVDVIAEKETRKYMIECKFHSDPGKKCDVKVSLYIHSRFLDIERQWKKQPEGGTRFHQGWIVTNTRFTEDAIDYGTCAGLHLIAWDYPSQGSLKERIDLSGFHPITALSSLNNKEKQDLLNMDLVLCRNLTEQHLENLGITGSRCRKVLAEAESLVAK